MLKLFDILKKNDYGGKLQLLLWSIIPVLLMCYFLAFKKTYRLAGEYSRNKMLAQQNIARQDISSFYDTKVNAINEWRKQYLLDSSVLDAQLIAKINASCNELGLNFKEYKPIGKSSQNIWTRLMTVEGDFKSILQLIHQMEQVDKGCRIASANFQKQKISGDNIEELYCTLYIQNVIDNSK